MGFLPSIILAGFGSDLSVRIFRVGNSCADFGEG